MIDRPIRTTALALLIAAALFGAWSVAADPTSRPNATLSTGFDQYAAGENGGFTMLHENVYVVGTMAAERVGRIVPPALGIDAVDVERDGGVLFSTEADGLVHHGGGTTRLSHDRVYRLVPSSGAIEAVEDWAARGIEIDSLDALDRLADGTLAFSTEHYRFVVHGGGASTLRPENAYTYDPATGSIELLFDGDALGLADLDALHVLGDGVFAVSTATDRQVNAAGGAIHLRHRDVYLVDGDSVGRWFDGAERGIQSIDALSLPGARALGGVLLVPNDPDATLEEGAAAVTTEYFVSLTRAPDRTTTIDLSSPDAQLDCAPDRIGFTPYDWLLPWTIRVVALDDTAAEGGLHRGSLQHVTVAGDPRWLGVELPAIGYAIRDNDMLATDDVRHALGTDDQPIDLDRQRGHARRESLRPNGLPPRTRPERRPGR